MADLFRLVVLVPLAYIAAVLASALIVAWAIVGPPEPAGAVMFVGGFLTATVYAGAFSFVPALVAVILAEAFAWRSVFYWLAVGGGIGLAAGRLSEAFAMTLADRWLATSLAAGFVGGALYWLIAGRLAGVARAGAAPDGPRLPAA